jgi:PilZ domain
MKISLAGRWKVLRRTDVRRPRKIKINATQVVQDIRSGMPEQELKEKYKITSHRVEKLFKRIVAAGAITESELAERYPAYREAISGINEFRNRRADLPIQLIVYDVTTSSLGLLRDISETGLRVAGINCRVGDERTFQIPLDTLMEVEPLLIVAKCKWVKARGKSVKYSTAGFEITDLSDDDTMILKTLVESLSGPKLRPSHNRAVAKKTAVEGITPDQNGAAIVKKHHRALSRPKELPGRHLGLTNRR